MTLSQADARKEIDRAVTTLLERLEEADYNPTPLVDLGILVAAADGHIDDAEVEMLRGLFGKLYGAGVNGELVSIVVDASRQVMEAAGVDARVEFLAEILLDCDAVEEGILIALAVAFASDGLDPPEREVIVKLARAAERNAKLVDTLEPIARAAGKDPAA